MENLDIMVLRALRNWRAAGKRALLATVVSHYPKVFITSDVRSGSRYATRSS